MTADQNIILEIPRRFVDQRFDVAVHALLYEKYREQKFSRGMIARLIEAGSITLNGVKARVTYRVRLHDMVELSTKHLLIETTTLEPRDTSPIPIIYEDKFLLALDKPAGLQVHPAGQSKRDTVAHFLVQKYPKLAHIGGNPLRPGIVHRLDKETSGVLAIAKTEEAFAGLKELFQNRQIEKTYVALVYGQMPSLEDIINKPILQSSGKLKRTVVETQNAPEAAREAVTRYRVVARYKDFDLLSVLPKTGRTHQIRAHFASLGHPIVGDKLYAFKPMRRGKKLFPKRHMLHARRLKFELLGKKYDIQAPVPDDFQSLLRDIDETRRAGYDDEALKSLLS